MARDKLRDLLDTLTEQRRAYLSTVQEFDELLSGVRPIHNTHTVNEAIDQLETACVATLPDLEDKLRRGFNG